MVEKQISPAKQAIENYKKYKEEYITLVKKNKPTIQKLAELEAEILKIETKLEKHNAAVTELSTQYDPTGDLVTDEDKKEWEALVPDKIKLTREDRLKELKKQLLDVAEDDLVTFPTVKRWLADKSKTNGPNDIKVLETQTGIPAADWKKENKKLTMKGSKLESYCG